MPREMILIYFAVFALLLVSDVSADTCPRNFYILTQDYNFAGKNLIFNYLDMDLNAENVQNSVKVRPGELVTVEVKWTWGPTCPTCVVHVNAFGSWAADKEITRLFSGAKGGVSATSTIPITFTAPDSLGEYDFRIIFAYDEGGFASNFKASNLCSKLQCKKVGECHILVAEGVINVTMGEEADDQLPPLVTITSPKAFVYGGFKVAEGDPVNIDAKIDDLSANLWVIIDGERVSNTLPYKWDTTNATLGDHIIRVEATDLAGNVGLDEMTVQIINKSDIEVSGPSLLWAYRAEGNIKSVSISSKGDVVAAGENNFIYLFEWNGFLKWKYDAQTSIDWIDITDDGEYIVAGGGNTVYLLNKDSTPLWNESFESGVSGVAISRGGDYIAVGTGDSVYLLSRNSTQLWNESFESGVSKFAISRGGDYVAVGVGNSGYLLGSTRLFDNETHKIWNSTFDRVLISLAITDEGDFMVVDEGNHIYMLNRNGTRVWNRSFEDGVVGITVVKEGRQIVTVSGTEIYFLKKDGNTSRQYKAGGEISSFSVSSNGGYITYSKGKKIFFLINLAGMPLLRAKLVLMGNLYLIAGAILVVLIVILVKRKGVKIITARPALKPPTSPEIVKEKQEEIQTGEDVKSVERYLDRIRKLEEEKRELESQYGDLKISAKKERDALEERIRTLEEEYRKATAEPELKGGSLNLKVVDSKTNAPVSSAKIFLNEQEKLTDGNGEAVFTNIPAGRHEIRVEMALYEPKMQVYSVLEGSENSLVIALESVIELGPEHVEILKNCSTALQNSFGSTSEFDQCIPRYYASIGENLISFVEGLSHAPEYFTTAPDRYREIIDSLTKALKLICSEMSRLMTDWKNIKLYRAATGLGMDDGCTAPELNLNDRIKELAKDPELFIESERPKVRSKLMDVDADITGKMGTLTMLPVSGLWEISKKLLESAPEKPGAEKAVYIFMAGAIIDYTEKMMKNERILERLEFSIF